MVYDPARITYRKLLEVFWANHSPTRRSWSRQYRSALFVADAEEERAAHESRDAFAKGHGGAAFTDIEPAVRFWPAEDYHQKYYLQRDAKLWQDVVALFPDEDTAVRSPLAARLNAWAGDYTSADEVAAELKSMELPDEACRRVLELLQ